MALGLVVALPAAAAGRLDWQTAPGYRWRELPVPAAGKTGFTLLPPQSTGILFTNYLSPERYLTNSMLLNGSGVAAGDVDGDGLCDLYFCGLDGPNALYRNLGNWKFQDVTAVAGVACPELDATGAVFADIDGDGDLDLIINSLGGGTHIFINDGQGHFTRQSNTPPLNYGKGGTSLALADIDGDGDLDLYVANYRTWTIRDRPGSDVKVDAVQGRPAVVRVNNRPISDPDLVGRFTIGANGSLEEHGEADALYLNDGRGRFSPLPFTGGTFLDEEGEPLAEPPYDWGLSVMFRDMNGDGAPDIYVCNDFRSPDRIWLNSGQGRFRAIPRLALRHTSVFSMGVDFADINRDGFDDFFVLDMLSPHHQKRHNQIGNLSTFDLPIGEIENRPQYSRNSLFLNRRDGTYAEISCLSGTTASEWSWTPIFLDVDLDGYEDLLITTGHELDAANADVTQHGEAIMAAQKLSPLEQLSLRKMYGRLEVPKVAFRNRGDLTFEEVGEAWGFNARTVSHGMALADLDGDGDMDLVVNNLNGAAGVYRNDGIAPRVAVRLKGRAPNTRGIGAKLWLYGGAVPMQSQEMICGGRYLSGDDAMRVFAAGSLTNEMRIEVRWRNGLRSVVSGVKANRLYEIDEAGAQAAPPEAKPEAKPLFEDVSEQIGHKHHEEEYNDFERQPLLARKLSQLGPGVGWHDLDGDGWEDLIIGSGGGGRVGVYHNEGGRGFKVMSQGPLQRVVGRDQTTVLGMGSTLIVGSSNYEDGQTNGGCVRIYDLQRQVGGDSILGEQFSRGPLALGDIDGDGTLDLFVGGRCVPGRYPEPADSLLLRNQGGKFVVAQRLEKVGLVSGAVFSDLDGDGRPELILACEWGPVRVFGNRAGRYVELTQELGLAEYTGWWNGVTTGDLDGDGRLDIIASNWGRNTRFEGHTQQPLRVYYGDFAEDGTVSLMEAYFEPEMNKVVPWRDLKVMSRALPFVQAKFTSYHAYGGASVEEILGAKFSAARELQATTLDSMVFLNRGGRFEAHSLPREAQFAPAFGVCVGDMDGDGNEDLFLSQNFFATSPEDWRQDAGRGLWLRGDGQGGFKAVSGQESGVAVYGEQRGCALADYDGDGRVDLVVTQNGAATKLYHNVGGKPGLRVRLKGGAGNPTAVGAQLRLIYGERKGPVREIHAGSGYWSQDGAVQVLGMAETPTQLWVRWPGGKTLTASVSRGAREIEVTTDGEVKMLH